MKTTVIILQTIAEVTGLIFWFYFALKGDNIGILFLLTGLIIEHFIAYYFLVSKMLPFLQLIGVSISETILWIIWLFLSQINLIVGIVFLTGTMLIQHTIEKNIFDGLKPFNTLFQKIVIPHTIIEGIGAFIWFIAIISGKPIIAIVLLSLFILVEHIQQANLPITGTK